MVAYCQPGDAATSFYALVGERSYFECSDSLGQRLYFERNLYDGCLIERQSDVIKYI
jgi:hypothetical protein